MIVCDEAVSALDVSIQAQVIDLLADLRPDWHCLHLHHPRPADRRHFADRIIVMKQGEIVEVGPVREVFENPAPAYTRGLLAAGLDPDPEVQKARRLILQPVALDEPTTLPRTQ